jgi:hypothetical protein
MLSRGKFVKVGVQNSSVLWTDEGVPFVEDDIPTIWEKERRG